MDMIKKKTKEIKKIKSKQINGKTNGNNSGNGLKIHCTQGIGIPDLLKGRPFTLRFD